MRFAITCATTLMAVAPACAKDCSVQHYRFVFGSDTDTTMTVKAGTVCTSTITAGTSISSATIAQAASNGTASILDSHRWSYRPRPGFKGQDTFVLAFSGTGTSNKFGRSLTGESKVSVAVDVVP